MADNKTNQDNLNNDNMGQTGGQESQTGQTGQKGGQAQSDLGNEDTNTGMANDPTSDTSLNDEDL